MPYPLSFRVRHAYKPTDRGVTVPVSLSAGAVTVKLFAKVDTGAEHCTFERGFAEMLLIDVERGTPLTFSTVAGGFRAYGHEVSLVSGWLNRVRLAQVDYDSLVHLSPYDE